MDKEYSKNLFQYALFVPVPHVGLGLCRSRPEVILLEVDKYMGRLRAKIQNLESVLEGTSEDEVTSEKTKSCASKLGKLDARIAKTEALLKELKKRRTMAEKTLKTVKSVDRSVKNRKALERAKAEIKAAEAYRETLVHSINNKKKKS